MVRLEEQSIFTRINSDQRVECFETVERHFVPFVARVFGSCDLRNAKNRWLPSTIYHEKESLQRIGSQSLGGLRSNRKCTKQICGAHRARLLSNFENNNYMHSDNKISWNVKTYLALWAVRIETEHFSPVLYCSGSSSWVCLFIHQ